MATVGANAPPNRLGAQSSSSEGNLYVCVRERESLAGIRLDEKALLEHARLAKAGGVVVFSLERLTGPGADVDAAVRAFFPGDGIPEDPVTGSAAGQLALLLQAVRPEVLPRKLVFTQGTELGREGRIELELRPEPKPGDVRAWVSGDSVVVLRGELDLRAVKAAK